MCDKKDITVERLRSLIDETGLARQAIADEMGCDVSTITKHYNGTRNLTIDFIAMYARYFNVSSDYLLGLSEVRTVSPDTAMICRVTGLDDKAVRTLGEINEPTNFENPKEIIKTLNYLIGELNYREQEKGFSCNGQSVLLRLSEYLMNRGEEAQVVHVFSNGTIFNDLETSGEEAQVVHVLSNGMIFDDIAKAEKVIPRDGNISIKTMLAHEILDNYMLSALTDAVRNAKKQLEGEA